MFVAAVTSEPFSAIFPAYQGKYREFFTFSGEL